MENDNNHLNNKKIIITGTSNRYQIKKLTTDKEPKKKRTVIIDSGLDSSFFTFENQIRILNEIKDNINKEYKLDKSIKISEETVLAISHIERKLNSYKHQDIEKKIFNENLLISFDTIIEKLLECNLKCFYCKNEMYILYQLVRENNQWTLDRIDNDKGHNYDNILISCLECNLKRRRQTKDNFLFTKQLKIVKKDEIS